MSSTSRAKAKRAPETRNIARIENQDVLVSASQEAKEIKILSPVLENKNKKRKADEISKNNQDADSTNLDGDNEDEEEELPQQIMDNRDYQIIELQKKLLQANDDIKKLKGKTSINKNLEKSLGVEREENEEENTDSEDENVEEEEYEDNYDEEEEEEKDGDLIMSGIDLKVTDDAPWGKHLTDEQIAAIKRKYPARNSIFKPIRTDSSGRMATLKSNLLKNLVSRHIPAIQVRLARVLNILAFCKQSRIKVNEKDIANLTSDIFAETVLLQKNIILEATGKLKIYKPSQLSLFDEHFKEKEKPRPFGRGRGYGRGRGMRGRGRGRGRFFNNNNNNNYNNYPSYSNSIQYMNQNQKKNQTQQQQ